MLLPVSFRAGGFETYHWRHVQLLRPTFTACIDARLDVVHCFCPAYVCIGEFLRRVFHQRAPFRPRHVQVPEYARATEIHLHPFLTHPYIALPPCDAEDETAILSSVQKHLLDTREYMRCSDVDTDWKVSAKKNGETIAGRDMPVFVSCQGRVPEVPSWYVVVIREGVPSKRTTEYSMRSTEVGASYGNVNGLLKCSMRSLSLMGAFRPK